MLHARAAFVEMVGAGGEGDLEGVGARLMILRGTRDSSSSFGKENT